jgi:hypothetical protein
MNQVRHDFDYSGSASSSLTKRRQIAPQSFSTQLAKAHALDGRSTASPVCATMSRRIADRVGGLKRPLLCVEDPAYGERVTFGLATKG